MSRTNVEWIIAQFGLQPHPEEGGYFAETYRSAEPMPGELPGRSAARHCFGTCIYYLLTPDTFSALHRLCSDEIFHFYLGDPVEMLQLHPDGRTEPIVLGTGVEQGQQLQVVVPRGVWQGSRLRPGGEFALLGCTVAPGFEYADYEHGDRTALAADYPDASEQIRRLTPEI